MFTTRRFVAHVALGCFQAIRLPRSRCCRAWAESAWQTGFVGWWRLNWAWLRFVKPFYLGLGVEMMRRPHDRKTFLKACGKLDKSSAQLLLDTRDWRGRGTVAIMIGVRQWDGFVEQIVRQLVASELVFAGQGYSVGLALIANDESALGLVSYLRHRLPEHDAFYNQHWAMAALLEVDRAQGSNYADQFMGEEGPWESWLAAQSRPGASLAPVGEIITLLRSKR